VAHVAADAERPPGGRQHHDPDVVALRQLGGPVPQRRRHRRADRVAAVGRVELQAGDAVRAGGERDGSVRSHRGITRCIMPVAPRAGRTA
jgi:hypothetical protein